MSAPRLIERAGMFAGRVAVRDDQGTHTFAELLPTGCGNLHGAGRRQQVLESSILAIDAPRLGQHL